LNLGAAVLLVLFIGAITSIISKKFKIAYTELLVIVGLLISIASHALGTPRELTGELIISLVLPPLIFQAALTMNYAVFKKVQRTVILLAVVSVAISAIVCSIIVASFTSLSLIAALAFGVIIAPTDAASVVDTLKRVKAPKELATIIEGEALLNDATTLVLFSAVSVLTLSPILNALKMLTEFVGGAVVGLILGFIANKLSPLLTDKNAEVMVTISVAYGSYILAGSLNFSGIVAVAILGLYIGRYHQETSPEESKNDLMLGFWNVAALIANTVAFVFIGLALEVSYLVRYAPLIGLSFVAVLVARYVSVESVLVPASRFIGSIPRSWRNTVFLGGIRGAVSAALALALPESAFKSVIVAVTLGVILLSLVAQTRALSYYVNKALR
jgi:CPA1 family monovalent cation:H+ antiporter